MGRPRLPRVPTFAPPASTRPPRRDFARFVDGSEPIEPSLPFTHLTDGYRFREFLEAREISPAFCRVFGEELVYLFYGRPAYRVAAEIESNALSSYLPVCFIVAPRAVEALRIYPFDSGGFHYQRYERFMDHRMVKEDFELNADAAAPNRMVGRFWGTNQRYYNNGPPLAVEYDAMDYEVQSYIGLINDAGKQDYDERNSAIELQVKAPIPFEGHVLAVILPATLAKERVMSQLREVGVLPIPFDHVNRHSAANIVAKIYDIVRDLYGGKHNRVKCW